MPTPGEEREWIWPEGPVPLDRRPPALAPSLALLRTEAERRKAIVTGQPGRILIRDDPNVKAWPFPPYAKSQAELVRRNSRSIDAAALKHGVEPRLIRATIWHESTHSFRDRIADLVPESIYQRKTILPMNVYASLWSRLATREELQDPDTNIQVGTRILAGILARVVDPTVDKIGTLFNSLAKDEVTFYGRTLAFYYVNQPWIDPPPPEWSGFRLERPPRW